MKHLLFALLLGAALPAAGQTNPRVLLQTDRGPLLLELDSAKAPNTVQNYLRYVDDGRFNDMIFHRAVKDFVVQAGAFKSNATPIDKFPTIGSERGNGLLNIYGSVAMALNYQNNAPNYNSGQSDFFINTNPAGNTNLDADFAVFGRVVFGLKTLQALNETPIHPRAIFPSSVYFSSQFQLTDFPVRPGLIKRAVRTSGFPIMDLHTGAWFDPNNAGRGFSVEIGQVAGGDENGSPLLVVYWYDYAEGKQIWMNGAAPFNWGDSEVTLNMQITEGGQFGSAFAPTQVTSNPSWGTLTVRFTGCGNGVFSYNTALGQGEWNLQRITLPTRDVCSGQ